MQSTLKLTKYRFLSIALLLGYALSLFGESEKPNIVYILADDLGYGDVSVYNPESKIKTPNIDRLADHGIRWTDVHTPSSVCTPTRHGILTGQYCWRSSLKKGVVWTYGRTFMEKERKTVANLLRQEGYNTAVIGKWHLGLDWALTTKGEEELKHLNSAIDENGGYIKSMKREHIDFSKPIERGPREFGFNYSFIIPGSLDIPPYCYVEDGIVMNAPTETTEGHDLDKGYAGAFWREGDIAKNFDFYDVLPNFCRRAAEYIEKCATENTPFFLYLPLPAPHTPWLPTQGYQGKSKAGMYGDYVQMVDDQVGRVLKAIEDAGIDENTLIIFTSDNGPYWLPDKIERFRHRSAAIYRGMKGDIWEGGHRVPFIASWKGKIKPGTESDALTSLTSFYATVADLLGKENPNQYGEDSYSILKVLLGKANKVAEQPGIMMHSSKAHFAWREGDWKYIEKRGSGGFSSPVAFEVRQGEPTAQLYNLKNDPGESENLFFRYPERVESMHKQLEFVRGQTHEEH